MFIHRDVYFWGNLIPVSQQSKLFDFIQLTGGVGDQGKMTWNPDEETVDLIQNGTVLQLGQESQLSVKNETGSEIDNGVTVMAVGTDGNSGKIKVAPWDGVTPVQFIVGVTTEVIANDDTGKVTSFGKVRHVDTSAFPAESVLYPVAGGGVTATEPVEGAVVPIAFVINSHASSGTYFVRFTPFDLNSIREIVLKSAVNKGIRLDPSDPSFGWCDLIGQITPSSSGASKPTAVAFRGAGIASYAFDANDAIDNVVFHIPHDWLPQATELFGHIHWGHNGTAISGDFVVEWYFQTAKGYSQEAFPVPITLVQTISTNITEFPQFQHNVSEFQIGNDDGSGGLLNISEIEVDSLILCGLKVTSIPTITGGTPNTPFIFTIDLHYQTTGINATKERNTPFYT